jgi:hypothetical protein
MKAACEIFYAVKRLFFKILYRFTLFYTIEIYAGQFAKPVYRAA